MSTATPALPASAVPEPAPTQAIDTPDITLPHQVAIFVLLMVCEFLYGWAWNTVDVLRPLSASRWASR
jgi:hypothetical protein